MAESSEDNNQELTQARNEEVGELAETLDNTNRVADTDAAREQEALRDRIRSLEQELKVRFEPVTSARIWKTYFYLKSLCFISIKISC
jgi:ElaB/YqjD/DUF883 family membrane-anchored ribosome-binding protein